MSELLWSMVSRKGGRGDRTPSDGIAKADGAVSASAPAAVGELGAGGGSAFCGRLGPAGQDKGDSALIVGRAGATEIQLIERNGFPLAG